MSIIGRFLKVSSTDPDDARRRKLLNILLLGSATLMLAALLIMTLVVVFGMVRLADSLWLYLMGAAVLSGITIILLISRYGPGWLASSIFLVLLACAIAFSDEPKQVVQGRSLFLLTIPILMASVLLRPYASFVAAGLMGLLLAYIAQTGAPTEMSTIPFATIGLMAVALVAWLAARSLENTLHDLRLLNEDLEQRVADRTQELADTNEHLAEALGQSDTLREVAKIVGASLDPQEVVKSILTQLEKVVMYHYANVTLLAGQQLKLLAGRDKRGGAYADFSIPLDRFPLNVLALQSKQPVVVPDVTRDERWIPEGVMASFNTRSFINAPLLVKDRPIGLLGMGRIDETLYTQEDAQLVFAFANQVAVALENARLHEYELEQVERELTIAQQIQASLLPSTAPEMHGLDMTGYSQAARQVGGDFYNYFVFGHEHLGIAVGDVSGKGMQAALMMSLSFGLLSNELRRPARPAALMAELNGEIHPHTQRNNLNTALCYVALQRGDSPDGPTWQARVANAGMIAPFLRSREGKVELLRIGGLPLGIIGEASYREIEQRLAPGDCLLLGSDGIVEAMNVDKEIYGFERLAERLASAPHGGAQAVQDWILADVRAFVGQAEMHDDLTMVVVLVNGDAVEGDK
ncbi:MAG: SpoIIE family protein phosphatase [Thermoflexales bacterium]|nr:SpoIIE family protein phosphatase [Thermoflexales bacterium]